MSLFLPPAATDFADFARKAATAINSILRGNIYPVSPTPPSDPQPGQGWYDSATNKAKVWDGSAWQALW